MRGRGRLAAARHAPHPRAAAGGQDAAHRRDAEGVRHEVGRDRQVHALPDPQEQAARAPGPLHGARHHEARSLPVAMTRNWAPLEGPQRAIHAPAGHARRPRAVRRRPRAAADGAARGPRGTRHRDVAERPRRHRGRRGPGASPSARSWRTPARRSPRAQRKRAGRRAAAARVQRVRAARRLARKRAAAAAFVQRSYTRDRPRVRDRDRDAVPGRHRQDFQETNQTYTQQTLPAAPAPKQDTAPAPKPQPSPKPAAVAGAADSTTRAERRLAARPDRAARISPE